MEYNKKEILLYQINSTAEYFLRQLEKEGNLDYFDIEISNHQGNVSIKKVEKDKKKVY